MGFAVLRAAPNLEESFDHVVVLPLGKATISEEDVVLVGMFVVAPEAAAGV